MSNRRHFSVGYVILYIKRIQPQSRAYTRTPTRGGYLYTEWAIRWALSQNLPISNSIDNSEF